MDHFESNQSSLNAWDGSDMDELRLNLWDMQSTGLVDTIYLDYLDPRKKISLWKYKKWGKKIEENSWLKKII